MTTDDSADLIARLWQALGDGVVPPASVPVSGPDQCLPSVFDVTGLATGTVGVATLAAAHLLATRAGDPMRAVGVDRRGASAAFLSEQLFTPIGWERPPIWDAIAGDYLAADGWIRLHTNYRYHRAAVERVLGAVADRPSVAAKVTRWSAEELQDTIVDAGGCAAAMNDREHWLLSPAGAASANEPIVRIEPEPDVGAPDLATPPADGGPLTGIRVLDLTRVIAGPVCTRFLAAYGADVLRIDPRGFEEVGSLVPETSAGKRCTMLDLTAAADRAVFRSLLEQAHVLVTGLRAGALDRLGYDSEHLRALNPHLIVARLNAYGWAGPWVGRRGFDSLVQMSSGIAAAGAAAHGSDHPVPLPAQALDHGTGYLLAAAICRALTELLTSGRGADVRCSLIGTANLLTSRPTPNGLNDSPPEWFPADMEAIAT
ncbi:MAG: CoA transferase, family protein, partial [Mycobacterium sp.]|nr:CoA transferase, family protein [Mycobacterium sp.]